MEAVGSVEEWVDRCGPLLDALAEAIAVRTTEGEIIYANEAALHLFGAHGLEHLRGSTDAGTLGGHLIQDEHGRPVSIERPFPPANAVAADPASPALVRVVDRVTGERRWWRFRSTPLHDVGGELIATITVIEDLTALKAAEARTRMLAESGRILVSSLDYEQSLRNVANVAVPELADWCAVDLASDDGGVRRVATASVYAHQDELESALEDFRRPEADPDHALRRVIRTGESTLYRRVTRDQLARWSTSARQLRVLQALDVRSVLLVPMRVPDSTIGAMTFLTASSGRFLAPDDRSLAEQLGRRAAVAVENARLHTRLTEVAETLERSLLPGEMPRVPGWLAASLYRPVSSRLRIDVGGDFFELFPAGERWHAIIGDIEGSGVTAATLTALMRYGARIAGAADAEPAAILTRLDDALRRHPVEATCTALCARLERDRLVLASAAHPPALAASSGGEIRELPSPGPLLGAFDDAVWAQEELPVRAGDLILFYTDGVTETLGRPGRVGRDRLRALLAEHAGRRPRELLSRLDAELRERRRDGRDDDLAALALARR